MEMTLRWFGEKSDSVSLKHIRQIPGVSGVITTLYDTKPGEEWDEAAIKKMKETVNKAGLRVSGIESVNVHDSIKAGDNNRDRYIQNYINTLDKLGRNGINMVCYNFMPVFDWTRSDLAKRREDGSTVLAYDQKVIDQIDPSKIFGTFEGNNNGFILPGWEPERMTKIKELFALYEGVDEDKLFENLKYFLEAIMPTCEKYKIKMAIHPDDPAWSVFGLPRIITSKENLVKMMKMVDSPYNGVTLCTGSLGSNQDNDIIDAIHALKGRIHFAHIRNLKFNGERTFEEAAHLSRDGSLDMFEIMKALYEDGFDGPIRPDHGRTIWDEVAMPGYGLYDRALGATYLNGIWESLEKTIGGIK
mgnify:CR=1 FL=1